MTEYCRLCAELKNCDEIVASIDDVEQSMEQKLRACCQWTPKNTEDCLPLSVCSICLDDLDKSWLFAQTVQFAQQRLREIFEETDTKPDPVVLTASDPLSAIDEQTINSSTRTDKINQQPLHAQGGQNSEHICGICSQAFCTVADLDAHQQRECEGLIEIESNFVDLKPSLVDFIESESEMETETKQKPFECQLCVHKPVRFATSCSLKRHLVSHINNSNGELRIDVINNKTRIIRADGDGDPILLGSKIYQCTDCNRVFDQRSSLAAHTPKRCSLNVHQIKHGHKSKDLTLTTKSQEGKNPERNPMPPAVDSTASDNGMDTGENAAVDDDGLNAIEEHEQMESNEALRPYKCETCDRSFRFQKHLRYHSVVHTKPKPEPLEFKCQLCDHKPFAKNQSLQCHLFAHVNESKGELKIDGVDDESRIIRTNGDGVPILLGTKVYECAECPYIFPDKFNLKMHLFKHVKDRTFDEYKYGDKGPFKCRLCHKEIAKKQRLCEHLVRHVLQSKGELKIEEINNENWKRPKFQIVPANGGGGAPIRIPGKVRLFKCEDCERVFTNKYNLRIHRTSHAKECPFECWQCHKMFKTLVRVRAHLKTHIRDGFKLNSICEQCGKAFKCSMALTLHKQTKHSDERPHKCEICGSRFKIEPHLKSHLLTHSEAPRFKCNQCDRAFKSNHSLQKHLETHSGVIAKKFPCDFCQMRFRRNPELQDHRSKHTGEKRFKCELCSTGFGARSSFHTHMRKVHGISLLALKKEKLRT